MKNYTKYVNPYLGEMLETIKMDKSFIKGEGCFLYDDHGNQYLDLIAAYGALPYGYNPKEIWDAISEYQDRGEPSFIQPSALQAAGELAKNLIELAPDGLKYVTFTNSGAEAVEAAIKLCRSSTGRLGILSTKNSFHGKTLGALSATGKAYYQDVFGAPIQGFKNIEFGSLEALQKELTTHPTLYAAFIVEPIQGEGGIVEAPSGYLMEVKSLCESHGVKLIVDEIQTGLGRTGHRFVCGAEGISPDVLLLAKALGGGIMPIGACIAKEEVYNEDFANKHSSTFAGNSLACRVGIKSLKLLKDDLLNHVQEMGKVLKDGLMGLKNRYPKIIKSIRGRGLMLGVEFNTDESVYSGSMLKVMAQQELLAPVISSYLLNVEGVRVAPTLNGTNVIRIEPPLIISEDQCRMALEAIENVLAVLNEKNTGQLLAFLVDKNPKVTKETINHKVDNCLVPNEEDERFAFLIHPIDLESYYHLDPSFTIFEEKELGALSQNIINRMVEPFVIASTKITSKSGKKAYGEFIAVAKTAEELTSLPRDQVLGELKKAVQLAKDRGAKIVGLGAYTSIVSGGGLYLKDEEVPLTTGNSFTIVSAVEGVTKALEKIGKRPELSVGAIVGATGAIGQGVSVLVSEEVAKVILIGNPNNRVSSEKRLYKVAGKIYKHLAKMQYQGKEFRVGSLGDKLKDCDNLPHWDATLETFIDFAQGDKSKEDLIAITTDINKVLPTANLVISATNNVGRLITPENLKQGAIVCDMSRPRNVSEEVLNLRPDVLAIDGGLIEVPGLPSLGYNFGFDEGLAYACMSETMMLSLEGHYQHTSLGASGITLESILLTRELSEKHGFKLADFRSFDKPITDEQWEAAMSVAQ